MNFKIQRISKGKKVNKLWHSINNKLNLKTKFICEKKRHTIISEIFWLGIS